MYAIEFILKCIQYTAKYTFTGCFAKLREASLQLRVSKLLLLLLTGPMSKFDLLFVVFCLLNLRGFDFGLVLRLQLTIPLPFVLSQDYPAIVWQFIVQFQVYYEFRVKQRHLQGILAIYVFFFFSLRYSLVLNMAVKEEVINMLSMVTAIKKLTMDILVN